MRSWLSDYTTEEIERMPVKVVRSNYPYGDKAIEYTCYAGAVKCGAFKYGLWANRDIMHAMKDKTKNGQTCLRFETSQVYAAYN